MTLKAILDIYILFKFHTSENIALINYDMFTRESESVRDACDFKFRAETEGPVKVTENHVF